MYAETEIDKQKNMKEELDENVCRNSRHLSVTHFMVLYIKWLSIRTMCTRAQCNAILKDKFGEIRSYDRCFACRAIYDHYEYKGLGPVDTMHILLAKKVGCNYFYTTDRSFKHLWGDPDFDSIRIEIID